MLHVYANLWNLAVCPFVVLACCLFLPGILTQASEFLATKRAKVLQKISLPTEPVSLFLNILSMTILWCASLCCQANFLKKTLHKETCLQSLPIFTQIPTALKLQLHMIASLLWSSIAETPIFRLYNSFWHEIEIDIFSSTTQNWHPSPEFSVGQVDICQEWFGHNEEYPDWGIQDRDGWKMY